MKRTTCWRNCGWRRARRANYGFYKGLIQFAGAFVHLQKDRLRPAAALFKLSRSYLEKYPIHHERFGCRLR